jgi:hypothetical protein
MFEEALKRSGIYAVVIVIAIFAIAFLRLIWPVALAILVIWLLGYVIAACVVAWERWRAKSKSSPPPPVVENLLHTKDDL